MAMYRKAVLLTAVAALAGVGGTGGETITESEASARTAIEKTVEEVLQVLSNKESSTAERLESIEQIVEGRFDLRMMSRLVLSRNWKRFSKEQQVEYETEFKKYLSNSYGSRIERFDQEHVDILGARDEARGDVTVQTRVLGGQADGVLIDYRLRATDGEWRVIDVVIEGISMVSNFRDQFKSVVSNGGPELLLKQLKEKNAAAPTTASVTPKPDPAANQ